MNDRPRCFAFAALAATLVPAISLAQKPAWTPVQFQPTVTPGPGTVAAGTTRPTVAPAPVSGPAVSPSPSLPARAVFAFHTGVIVPAAENAYGDAVEVTPQGEVSAFVGSRVVRRDVQHTLALGGQLRIDADSTDTDRTGMFGRLEFAAQFRWG